ncbi:ATP-binding protein [Sphingomonas sp.]|uniref:ATP/GTP-binding protein n=1 Tax=Sphingomonas sp. TaxID=28214 RepID=UPI002DE94C01|nr:ATP-binding protein [Sphingomonas sp.]
MLKVLVTGAYSTGKTGLVNSIGPALQAHGLQVDILPDTARTCPFPLNKEQTGAASLWLIGTQISREIERSAAVPDILICDRGVPDVLAHDLEAYRSGRGSGLELLKPFLAEWTRTYDLLLLSRVDRGIPVEPDGLRVEDPEYRDLLDGLAAEVLLGVAGVLELPPGPEDRLVYAREAILARLSKSSVRIAPET